MWESFGWQRLYPHIRTSPNDAHREMLLAEKNSVQCIALYIQRLDLRDKKETLGLPHRQ